MKGREINTRPARRGREGEKIRDGGEIDICPPDVLSTEKLFYEMERREWKGFWSWSSWTTASVVTEITLNLPLRVQLLFLKLSECVFGLSCLSSCYIHNTKAATHSLTLALLPSLLLFLQQLLQAAIRANAVNL